MCVVFFFFGLLLLLLLFVVIKVKGGRIWAIGERQWVREPESELSIENFSYTITYSF